MTITLVMGSLMSYLRGMHFPKLWSTGNSKPSYLTMTTWIYGWRCRASVCELLWLIQGQLATSLGVCGAAVTKPAAVAARRVVIAVNFIRS